jgi:hypothetical protein
MRDWADITAADLTDTKWDSQWDFRAALSELLRQNRAESLEEAAMVAAAEAHPYIASLIRALKDKQP